MKKSDYKTIAIALAKVAFERKTYLHDAVHAVFSELHPNEEEEAKHYPRYLEMDNEYNAALEKLHSDAEQALKTPHQVAYENHEQEALQSHSKLS